MRYKLLTFTDRSRGLSWKSDEIAQTCAEITKPKVTHKGKKEKRINHRRNKEILSHFLALGKAKRVSKIRCGTRWIAGGRCVQEVQNRRVKEIKQNDRNYTS